MSSDLLIPAVIFGGIATFALSTYVKYRRRLAFIDGYQWPKGLIERLRHHHPSLPDGDISRIEQGLRQFFRAYLKGGFRYVSMPSQAVDDLWHEFILYTRSYDEFCRKAFGRFLHHTPAVVLAQGKKQTNEGLRRVWWQCCKEEGIDPKTPAALPLLFALDTDLAVPNGYRYVPDCRKPANSTARGQEFTIGVSFGAGTQCGGDFSSTSFDGGTDGLGDGDGSGDGGDGGDGGGCGGD
ncbi:MAG: hypothetical protein JNM89_02075 [Hyphomicrobiaceae bacterium]|nr:hypothetical protein [Hyphomicrobiaceae bacterium]